MGKDLKGKSGVRFSIHVLRHTYVIRAIEDKKCSKIKDF